ncbi:3 TM domain-containing transmembrane protein, partial [Acrasis kona]
MDLEGTDSKERGEENMSFERKISLFALSIAEVLLVNMWQNDIGRFQASNYSLLKTVFELNLQLFQKDRTSKTLLLFVIRDHIAETSPLSVLRKQIQEDVDKIWTSIIKPPEFKDSSVMNFFDFKFTSLPHKVLQEKEWYERVSQLRNRFVDKNNEEFVFLDQYKKSVPIDGLNHFASSVWDVIISNKDLDLPTQKEMLAMYRCGEIAKEVFEQFNVATEEWQKKIKNKQIITRFGENAKKIVDAVLADYDSQTSLYVKDVAAKRREELESKMKSELLLYYNSQLDLIRHNALEFFQKLLTAATAKGGILTDFTDAINLIRSKIDEFFIDGAKNTMYPGENWNFQTQLDTLHEEVNRFVSQARKDQLQMLLSDETQTITESVQSNISPLLHHPTPDMWIHIREQLQTILRDVEDYLTNTLKKGFESSDAELQEYKEKIRRNANQVVYAKIKDSANHLSLKMYKKFEDGFRFENGVPKVFRSIEEITNRYQTSLNHSLQLLDLFFLCRIEPSMDDHHLDLNVDIDIEGLPFPELDPQQQELILLNQESCLRLFENFSLKCQSSLKDAQTNFLAQQARRANIPMWIFPILLVLGWNEFMYILSRPLLLIVLLLLGLVFFWTYLRSELYQYVDSPDANATLALALRFVLSYADKFLTPAVLMGNRAVGSAAAQVSGGA